MNKCLDLIVLSGGFGTRLQPVSKGLPKALMPIGNHVCLDLLFEKIIKYNIRKIILSIFYRHDLFLDYLRESSYSDLITPIIEPKPLGTGGAIKYVLENSQISNPFFTINGDTLSNINYSKMNRVFNELNYDAMVGISYVKDSSRFGTVQFYGDRLIQFSEKGSASSGWINNGHYILKQDVFNGLSGNFSIEYDVFPKLAEKNRLGVFKVSNDNFIDMGVPEDYEKLCNFYKVSI